MKKETRETILIIVLSLLSFGGATGRFNFGFSFFDIMLILLLGHSFLKKRTNLLYVKKRDLIVFGILFFIIAFGAFRSKIGVSGLRSDYFITELRFYIYIPLLYYLSLEYKLNIDVFKKILPIILITYLIFWGVLLTEESAFYQFFNDDIASRIGNEERISGPPILALYPFLLILIKERSIKLLSLILYLALALLVFIKTGGRTYFVFSLLPIFYILFKNRKRLVWLVLSIILLFISFFLLKEFTSSVFFERFLNIANAKQDSSFMYRVFNIEKMLNGLNGTSLWLGNGIGSNYEFNFFGLRTSYFLDNTFITLLYKTGIIGLILFLSIFFINNKWIPRDIYYFELLGLILIALLSYHIILNPVFIFGYFLILNYYRNQNHTILDEDWPH